MAVVDIQTGRNVIRVGRLKNEVSLANYLAPAKEEVLFETVAERSAQPIKDLHDIYDVSNYLKDNHRYRDNMLFIVGINFGLRIGDLLELRFLNIINDDFSFKTTFPVFEHKTRNTRKRKKNRYITINDAVKEAVILYLENKSGVCLSDYMFVSNSNNSIKSTGHLTTRGANYICDGIKKDLELGMRFSSHSLRKTFCYHQMLMSHNDPRKLLLLQKMLGHSSMLQTLDYIGITEEEFEDAYKELNLGLSEGSYLIDSDIEEADAV